MNLHHLLARAAAVYDSSIFSFGVILDHREISVKKENSIRFFDSLYRKFLKVSVDQFSGNRYIPIIDHQSVLRRSDRGQIERFWS